MTAIHWTAVAAEAELFEGAAVGVQVSTPEATFDLALYLTDGQVYVTDNQCTHGAARLCDGYLEGMEIECPFHQGRFDIRSGEPTAAPCDQPVRIWPVKLEAGRVWVALPG